MVRPYPEHRIGVFAIYWLIPAVMMCLVLTRTPTWAEDGAGTQPKKYDIVFPVKLFCSEKRSVRVPFKGIIEEVYVNAGQEVKKGDLLARYHLSIESKMALREKLGNPRVKDLEIEREKVSVELADLRAFEKGANKTGEGNDKGDSRSIFDRIRQRETLKRSIEDRLRLEKALAEDEGRLLEERLGEPLDPDRVPGKAVLKSPMDGYVVWISPDVKKGTEVLPPMEAFQVGVMDPLTARADVFEYEALKIAPGDQGTIIIESMREKEFDVQVAYVSWVPRSSGILNPSYYTVLMTIQNPDLKLREGLMGSVRFTGRK